LYVSYVGLQVLLIGGFFLLPEHSLIRVVWQVAVGWLAAGFVLSEVLRRRIRDELVRVLFAIGIFLNAAGILIEHLQDRAGVPVSSPHLADLFWLSLYPCLILALAIVVYRHSAFEDRDAMAAGTSVSTIITIGMGIVAWELIIVPQAASPDVSVMTVMVTSLYPMGDLVLLALILRLLLSGGAQNWAFRLMLAAVLCFLAADLGWVIPHRSGEPLPAAARHILMATSLGAFASLGAAVCHPAFREAAPLPGGGSRSAAAVWGTLAVSLLIAPAVLGIEALVDKLYGAVP
jgi:hypothetical protein